MREKNRFERGGREREVERKRGREGSIRKRREGRK